MQLRIAPSHDLFDNSPSSCNCPKEPLSQRPTPSAPRPRPRSPLPPQSLAFVGTPASTSAVIEDKIVTIYGETRDPFTLRVLVRSSSLSSPLASLLHSHALSSLAPSAYQQRNHRGSAGELLRKIRLGGLVSFQAIHFLSSFRPSHFFNPSFCSLSPRVRLTNFNNKNSQTGFITFEDADSGESAFPTLRRLADF